MSCSTAANPLGKGGVKGTVRSDVFFSTKARTFDRSVGF
jgi:hypothetical protein